VNEHQKLTEMKSVQQLTMFKMGYEVKDLIRSFIRLLAEISKSENRFGRIN